MNLELTIIGIVLIGILVSGLISGMEKNDKERAAVVGAFVFIVASLGLLYLAGGFTTLEPDLTKPALVEKSAFPFVKGEKVIEWRADEGGKFSMATELERPLGDNYSARFFRRIFT